MLNKRFYSIAACFIPTNIKHGKIPKYFTFFIPKRVKILSNDNIFMPFVYANASCDNTHTTDTANAGLKLLTVAIGTSMD